MTTLDISLEPITATFGAVLSGIDLARGITDAACAVIHDAVIAHGVVALRHQQLDDDAMIELARHWGELQVYAPFRSAGMDVPLEWVEDTEDSPPKAFRWHTDIPW